MWTTLSVEEMHHIFSFLSLQDVKSVSETASENVLLVQDARKAFLQRIYHSLLLEMKSLDIQDTPLYFSTFVQENLLHDPASCIANDAMAREGEINFKKIYLFSWKKYIDVHSLFLMRLSARYGKSPVVRLRARERLAFIMSIVDQDTRSRLKEDIQYRINTISFRDMLQRRGALLSSAFAVNRDPDDDSNAVFLLLMMRSELPKFVDSSVEDLEPETLTWISELFRETVYRNGAELREFLSACAHDEIIPSCMSQLWARVFSDITQSHPLQLQLLCVLMSVSKEIGLLTLACIQDYILQLQPFPYVFEYYFLLKIMIDCYLRGIQCEKQRLAVIVSLVNMDRYLINADMMRFYFKHADIASVSLRVSGVLLELDRLLEFDRLFYPIECDADTAHAAEIFFRDGVFDYTAMIGEILYAYTDEPDRLNQVFIEVVLPKLLQWIDSGAADGWFLLNKIVSCLVRLPDSYFFQAGCLALFGLIAAKQRQSDFTVWPDFGVQHVFVYRLEMANPHQNVIAFRDVIDAWRNKLTFRIQRALEMSMISQYDTWHRMGDVLWLTHVSEVQEVVTQLPDVERETLFSQGLMHSLFNPMKQKIGAYLAGRESSMHMRAFFTRLYRIPLLVLAQLGKPGYLDLAQSLDAELKRLYAHHMAVNLMTQRIPHAVHQSVLVSWSVHVHTILRGEISPMRNATAISQSVYRWDLNVLREYIQIRYGQRMADVSIFFQRLFSHDVLGPIFFNTVPVQKWYQNLPVALRRYAIEGYSRILRTQPLTEFLQQYVAAPDMMREIGGSFQLMKRVYSVPSFAIDNHYQALMGHFSVLMLHPQVRIRFQEEREFVAQLCDQWDRYSVNSLMGTQSANRFFGEPEGSSSVQLMRRIQGLLSHEGVLTERKMIKLGVLCKILDHWDAWHKKGESYVFHTVILRTILESLCHEWPDQTAIASIGEEAWIAYAYQALYAGMQSRTGEFLKVLEQRGLLQDSIRPLFRCSIT